MKTKSLIAALLLTASSAFAQVPSYVPTNGLVGWWPFNGNANDESGNGNNGTVNGAMLTSDRLGRKIVVTILEEEVLETLYQLI